MVANSYDVAACSCTVHEIFPGRYDLKPHEDVLCGGYSGCVVLDREVPGGRIAADRFHGYVKGVAVGVGGGKRVVARQGSNSIRRGEVNGAPICGEHGSEIVDRLNLCLGALTGNNTVRLPNDGSRCDSDLETA